jgi:hypothetical protein
MDDAPARKRRRESEFDKFFMGSSKKIWEKHTGFSRAGQWRFGRALATYKSCVAGWSFTPPAVILSGAKNLSGIRLCIEPREILRFA